jgi:hypothetical protein
MEVGRIVGKNDGNAPLTNNYALECMKVNDTLITNGTHTNIEGENISDMDAIAAFAYTSNDWDFSTVWTFDYTNYNVAPQTNLPILAAFSNVATTALQSPSAECAPIIIESCIGDSVAFVGEFIHGGTLPQFQWFVNGEARVGATDTIFGYVPEDGDAVTYRMISNEECGEPLTVFSPKIIITVNPLPTLSSASNMPATCSSIAEFYTPTSNTAGATFSWHRPAVGGIAEPANSGFGTINEVLTNLTNQPITVTYQVTITANGCTNTQPVTIVVKPRPKPKITIKQIK